MSEERQILQKKVEIKGRMKFTTMVKFVPDAAEGVAVPGRSTGKGEPGKTRGKNTN